mgnify:CR=1 FL=1
MTIIIFDWLIVELLMDECSPLVVRGDESETELQSDVSSHSAQHIDTSGDKGTCLSTLLQPWHIITQLLYAYDCNKGNNNKVVPVKCRIVNLAYLNFNSKLELERQKIRSRKTDIFTEIMISPWN